MAEEFLLKVITPERVFCEEMVTMVEFNTTEGEIGVYKNHIPLTVIIKPGILTLTTKDGVKNAALHSGFAEILQDKITILAEVVEWPEEIDENRAKRAAEQAKEAILQKKSIQDYYSAQAKMARALGRLRAKKEGKF